MKKSIAALVAGATFALVPAAYAAEPVQLSGEVSVTYERDKVGGVTTDSGTITTMTINGELDLGSNWSLYSRLAGQRVTKAGMGDYNDAYYGTDDKSVLALDQFGFNYKGKDFTYKIGRQDVTVGTTALLYARTDLGKKNLVDGVTVSGKSGVTDLTGVFVREDNVSGDTEGKIFAVRGGFNPQENLNVGLTLGRYKGDDSTNHWAFDTTYTFGKSSLIAEYTKSNSSDDNQAYATTLNYDFDGRTAAYVTGFRVEDNGSMNGYSDFDAGNRGFHYGVTHTLKDNLALEMVYKNQKEIGSGVKNTAWETTLTYSF